MKKLYNIQLLIIVLPIILFSCATQDKESNNGAISENPFDFGELNRDAPIETKILGQFVGIWEAEHSIRKQDGSWSDNKTKSFWKWYYILNGHAIQDDWITIDSLGKQQVVGTNIRIYNIEE